MKNLIKTVPFLFGILIAISGCTPSAPKIPEPMIYHDSTKATGANIQRRPELNSINTVEIGVNMYMKINQFSYDTYGVKLLNQPNQQPSSFTFYGMRCPNPQILHKWSSNNWNAVCYFENTFIIDVNNTGYFTQMVDNVRDITDINKTENINEINDIDEIEDAVENISKITGLKEVDAVNGPIKYELIPTPPMYTQDIFKWDVIYQGRVENKIKISYREFYKDTARSAFTQDIEYELNKSGDTIIGFKGLRIKVIKATNMDITFSIIHDYDI